MPQSRKRRPIRIFLVCKQQGILWQINALLICIMHKPWAVCKRTPEPLTWYAISPGQVSPNRPRESVLPFLWHTERTSVWNSWGKLPFDNDASSGHFGTGRGQTYSPVHHFVRYVGRTVFASFFHTEINACPVTKLFLLFLLQNHTMTQHSS